MLIVALSQAGRNSIVSSRARARTRASMAQSPDEALIDACWKGDLTAAKIAVTAGASLLRRTLSRAAPLLWACDASDTCGWRWLEEKRHKLIAWIISHRDGRKTLDWGDDLGVTPLIMAIASGAPFRTVDLLLREGADPTMCKVNGSDARSWAVAFDRRHINSLIAYRVLEWPVNSVGEWRPHLQSRFPRTYRRATRTLLILAKARDMEKSTEKMWYSCHPQACLGLLPEELLQYLFALLTCAPHEKGWLPEIERYLERGEW